MNIKPVLDSILARARRPNFLLRVVSTAFLTLLIFYVLFLFIDIAEVVDIISRVSLTVIIIGFLFYVGSTLFRAVRFHVIHPRIPIRSFFSITSVHALFTNVMPAKTGELAFPVLLKRVDGSTFMSSLSMLFIVRIFDLVAVFMLFFVALAMTYSRLDARLHILMLIVSIVFVVGLAVIFSIFMFGKKALAVACRMLFFDGLKNNKGTAWVFSKLELLFDTFHVIRQPHALWRILLFSLLIWFCNYAAVIMIVHSMGLGFSMWVLALGFTFSMLFSTLPINGLGSFGTLEAAWTLIFLSFGAAKEISFATGFGFHIIITSYLILLGIFGMVHLVFLPKPARIIATNIIQKQGKE